MKREVKIFLIASISVILLAFIAVIIALSLAFPDLNLNEVAEKDWHDDWKKEYIHLQPTKVSFYSRSMYYNSKRYIIKNFTNNSEIAKKVLAVIDSLKHKNNDSATYFKFLWNDKYNHDWRVEYVNQKYVDEVATLFSVTLVYPQKTKNYLIENITLYPSLQKKQKIKIWPSPHTVDVLLTDYANGFDFFLWNELQDYMKKSNPKNNKKYTLVSSLNNSKIVMIGWTNAGYRLYF